MQEKHFQKGKYFSLLVDNEIINFKIHSKPNEDTVILSRSVSLFSEDIERVYCTRGNLVSTKELIKNGRYQLVDFSKKSVTAVYKGKTIMGLYKFLLLIPFSIKQIS